MTLVVEAHVLEAPVWPVWVPSVRRRRLDPVAQYACAAVEAVREQCTDAVFPTDMALVVHSSAGAVQATRRFLESLHSFGDSGVSPTPFISSVHNALAGVLSQLLGCTGPCFMVAEATTEARPAVTGLAERLLLSQRCQAVLGVSCDVTEVGNPFISSDITTQAWAGLFVGDV